MGSDDLVQRCTRNRTVNKSKYKSDFSAIDQRIQGSVRVLATVPHSGHRFSASYASSSSHAPTISHTPFTSPTVNCAPALSISHAPYASHALPTHYVSRAPRRRSSHANVHSGRSGRWFLWRFGGFGAVCSRGRCRPYCLKFPCSFQTQCCYCVFGRWHYGLFWTTHLRECSHQKLVRLMSGFSTKVSKVYQTTLFTSTWVKL